MRTEEVTFTQEVGGRVTYNPTLSSWEELIIERRKALKCAPFSVQKGMGGTSCGPSVGARIQRKRVFCQRAPGPSSLSREFAALKRPFSGNLSLSSSNCPHWEPRGVFFTLCAGIVFICRLWFSCPSRPITAGEVQCVRTRGLGPEGGGGREGAETGSKRLIECVWLSMTSFEFAFLL